MFSVLGLITTLSVVLSGSGGPGLSLIDDTVTFAAGQQVSFARISVVGDETYSGDGARTLLPAGLAPPVGFR